jgi:hypothetical protein
LVVQTVWQILSGVTREPAADRDIVAGRALRGHIAHVILLLVVNVADAKTSAIFSTSQNTSILVSGQSRLAVFTTLKGSQVS